MSAQQQQGVKFHPDEEPRVAYDPYAANRAEGAARAATMSTMTLRHNPAPHIPAKYRYRPPETKRASKHETEPERDEYTSSNRNRNDDVFECPICGSEDCTPENCDNFPTND